MKWSADEMTRKEKWRFRKSCWDWCWCFFLQGDRGISGVKGERVRWLSWCSVGQVSFFWFSHSWANYYWAPHGVWWRVLYDRCTAEEEKLLLDLQWLLYYVCASTHSHNSVSVQGSTLQIQGPRGFKGSKGDPVRWGFCCNCHLLEGRCRTFKKKTINK